MSEEMNVTEVQHYATLKSVPQGSNMDVFYAESGVVVPLGLAKEVLERRLDPRLIKERKQAGTTLSYIGGHTVIRLLNEAFEYKWSFEIVSEEIVPSQPKALMTGYGASRKAVTNQDGTPKLEAQPPVVKVLGRLTVPGYGIKEQYGSKVVIGGATEQEASFKSASTDALKKCATLFGIGLELYEDDDETPANGAVEASAPTIADKVKEKTPASASTRANAATPASAPAQWSQESVNKLKELKGILGITQNEQLDPYVREFLDKPDANSRSISPTNIDAFNIFLAKKALSE